MKSKVAKESLNCLFSLLAAVISALTLHVFVYKNGFAPSGVDGISTMIQELWGINAGITSLIMNLPLLVIAYFFLDRKFVLYTIVYIILSSAFIYILAEVNFYQYEAKYEKFVAAIFSGLLLGIRTGIMIRAGFSTGGVDIIACIIQNRAKHINIERIISGICYITILASFFVYRDLSCILLSLVQMFVFEKGADFVLRDNRDAVEFKIVTRTPEKLKEDIMFHLKHGATVVNSKGMFTDESSSIIISLVNSRQVPEFLKILKKYPDSFVYYTEVRGVKGNFRWKRGDAVK